MGGLSDFLFGSKPQTNNQVLPTQTPEQQALMSRLVGGASGSPDVAGSWNTSAPYSGGLTTEMSPLQNTSLAALEEAAMQRVRGPTPSQSTAQSTVDNAQQIDPAQLEKEFGAMFQGSVADPTMKDFQRNVVPELSRRFSGSSTFSSDRRSAEGDVSGRLGEALTAGRSSGFFQYLNDAKTRALTAAGMSGGVEGAGIAQDTSLLASGGVPTALNQQNIQMQYSEFQRQQKAKMDSYNQALMLLGIKPMENVVTATPGTGGFLNAAAGGVGAAATKFALA